MKVHIGIRKWAVGFFAALLATMLLTTLAGSSIVSAQDSQTTDSSSTVTVQGQGVVSVAPDAASTTIGVTETASTLSDAQSNATDAMNAVTDAIKAAGVDTSDIQTTNYSVQPIQNYDENGNPAGAIQFQVSNQVTVIIRDLSTVGAVLDGAVQAGANNIWGINFFVTDSSDAVAEARVNAVADAQDRAEQLAAAANMKLGTVVSMSEVAAPNVNAPARGGAMSANAEAVPIESGANEIRVTVQVVYNLI